MSRLQLRFGHASMRELLRHVDTEVTLPQSLRQHLSSCSRCRNELQSLRDLQRAARNAPIAEPSDVLLARVHARLEDGETLLLPSKPVTLNQRGDGGPASARARLIAIAAAVLVCVGVFARPASDVRASNLTGDMQFMPSKPRAGDSIEVAFRAPTSLANEERLVLRGRFRTGWSVAYNDDTRQEVVTTLTRNRDGVFRGAFKLRPDVMFGAFAVEDATGARVDSHLSRLWELLVVDSMGRPLLQALSQHANDLMGRNSLLALEAARQGVALYPQRPDAWRSLYFFERISLGADADSAFGAYRLRLGQLSQLWSNRPDVPLGVVDGIMGLSAAFTDHGDSLRDEVNRVWKARYERETALDRGDPVGARARWGAIFSMASRADDRHDRDSIAIALNLAERFWNSEGHRNADGARRGLDIALLVPDSTDARLRWFDRGAAWRPLKAPLIYRQMARDPKLRVIAAQRLEKVIGLLLQRRDSLRPLEQTVAEALRADSLRAQQALGYLADAQLAVGDSSAARATLLRATSRGWSPSLFRRTAQMIWSGDNRVAAAPLLANLATDPSSSVAVVDSLTALAHSVVPPSRWARLLDSSRTRMERHFLGSASYRMLPRAIVLESTRGPISLAEVASRHPVVAIFCAESCGPSGQQAEFFRGIAHALASLDAKLVLITDRPFSEQMQAASRVDSSALPVYFDRSGDARRAFNSWSYPEVHVVDADGALRFSRSAFEELLGQVAALNAERVNTRRAVAETR